MRSINKVILIGNLTRDPEMKQTQSGQPVTTFGLATNREWMTKGSDRKKSTEFHEIVAWAKLAEVCHTYLRKGKLVYIEGYLKTRSWEMENGEKKFRTEIVLHDMIMLEKRPGDHGDDHADSALIAASAEASGDSDVYLSDEPISDDNPSQNVF
ncbi:MAG: single-stranded DNA-binding protein [Patescibacteria group bacterium]